MNINKYNEVENHKELSRFQKECFNKVIRILEERDVKIVDVKINNSIDSLIGWYIYCAIIYSNSNYSYSLYSLYIYDNEAEIIFCKKEDYSICEHYDYNSQGELIEDYCNKLITTLETGVPWKPKPGWISKLFERIINFTRNHLP